MQFETAKEMEEWRQRMMGPRLVKTPRKGPKKKDRVRKRIGLGDILQKHRERSKNDQGD